MLDFALLVLGMFMAMTRFVVKDEIFRFFLTRPGNLYIMGIGIASASITHFFKYLFHQQRFDQQLPSPDQGCFRLAAFGAFY